jgi:hypothetical protein
MARNAGGNERGKPADPWHDRKNGRSWPAAIQKNDNWLKKCLTESVPIVILYLERRQTMDMNRIVGLLIGGFSVKIAVAVGAVFLAWEVADFVNEVFSKVQAGF